MTPFHLLSEADGVYTAGTVSNKISYYNILLTTRPSNHLLTARTLPETSRFSNLPLSVGEVMSDGIRVGYLFHSRWHCVNILSGLLYISGSWWETAKDPSIPPGEFPMLYRNADISLFSTQNKVAMVVCGEIPLYLQDLLRL